MKYKVTPNMDDNYLVIQFIPNEKYDENNYDSEEPEFYEQTVYDGSLANCEAYIRLHEAGYM